MIPAMPHDRNFDVIDRRAELNAIRQKHGDRYWAVPDAQWEAAALWGVTPDTNSINDCGVFTYRSDEFCLSAGRCKAEIDLVQAPNQLWAMSTSYQTAIGGGGSAPSVWDRAAYPTRDDALMAGIHHLIDRFKSEAVDPNSCNGDSNKRNALQMVALLEAEKTPQLALF